MVDLEKNICYKHGKGYFIHNIQVDLRINEKKNTNDLPPTFAQEYEQAIYRRTKSKSSINKEMVKFTQKKEN